MNFRLSLASIPSISLLLIGTWVAVVSSARIPTGGQVVAGFAGAPTPTHEQAAQISEFVREVFQDRNGDFWLGTNGEGVCRYDGTSFIAFGADQGLTINDLPCPCGSGSRYENCHGPNGGHVQEIFEDKDGILWFGCSGGLFRLDGNSFVNVTRDGPWPVPTEEPGPALHARAD